MRCTIRYRRRGLTLIDMVVVVMMIGIVAAVTGPKFSSAINSRRAEAGARLIAADLNYLRRQAISRSRPVLVEFDTATVSYSTDNAPAIDRHDQRFHRELTKWAGNVQFKPSFDNRAAVQFDIRGTPSVAGEAMTSGIIWVTSAQSTWQVSVDSVTGQATAVPANG